jgi:hypothetical protein
MKTIVCAVCRGFGPRDGRPWPGGLSDVSRSGRPSGSVGECGSAFGEEQR